MGILGGQSDAQRMKEFSSEMNRRSRDAFYYAPPGGESVANCALRVESWLNNLRKSCSGTRVVCVCHGNIMKAVQIRIEKRPQKEWTRLRETKNCEVIHYSRRNPENGKVSTNLNWVRSVCPWVLSEKTVPTWKRIERIAYSNQELLDYVSEIPRIVHSPDSILNEGEETQSYV